MNKRPLKYYLTGFFALVLAFATAAVVYQLTEQDFSRPQPLRGRTEHGFYFTVVAMKGNQAVEQLHECSGGLLVSGVGDMPVVSAKTGRAAGNFRYYLTNADLTKANSQLDSKPGQFRHDVQVQLLEDNPSYRTQTVQVTVHGEDTDFINVYKVQNESVQPLKWKRFRRREMIVVLPLMPVVVGLSYFVWKRLILMVWR